MQIFDGSSFVLNYKPFEKKFGDFFSFFSSANIELHDTNNYTALLIAASYDHKETIEVLLQHKANVRAVDKNDKNIVYICSEKNSVNALQVCIFISAQ